MKDRILELLKQVSEDAGFEHSANFIEDGLMDSFQIVDLVSELEDEFSIEISGKDIIPENFMNLDTIGAMVRKYTGEE